MPDYGSSRHSLANLLPETKSKFLRNRGHDFILPHIKTERFKKVFLK